MLESIDAAPGTPRAVERVSRMVRTSALAGCLVMLPSGCPFLRVSAAVHMYKALFGTASARYFVPEAVVGLYGCKLFIPWFRVRCAEATLAPLATACEIVALHCFLFRVVMSVI